MDCHSEDLPRLEGGNRQRLKSRLGSATRKNALISSGTQPAWSQTGLNYAPEFRERGIRPRRRTVSAKRSPAATSVTGTTENKNPASVTMKRWRGKEDVFARVGALERSEA